MDCLYRLHVGTCIGAESDMGGHVYWSRLCIDRNYINLCVSLHLFLLVYLYICMYLTHVSSVHEVQSTAQYRFISSHTLSGFRVSLGRYWKAATMLRSNDFTSVFGRLEATVPDSGDVSEDAKRRKLGTENCRENLRPYETLPAQLLNAYGMAGYAKMPMDRVWEEMNKPLKTGAKYMTELCSPAVERRAVGINRFLQGLVEYLKYQKTEAVKKQNEFIMKPDLYQQVYLEIDLIYEAAVYCLAGKKMKVSKDGAASLRSGVSFEENAGKNKDLINEKSKILYDWIRLEQSRLRMLMVWQSSGGLAFVSATHLLGVQCFILHGGKYHGGEPVVSLETWQEAVLKRHEMEHTGHVYLQGEVNKDFI